MPFTGSALPLDHCKLTYGPCSRNSQAAQAHAVVLYAQLCSFSLTPRCRQRQLLQLRSRLRLLLLCCSAALTQGPFIKASHLRHIRCILGTSASFCSCALACVSFSLAAELH